MELTEEKAREIVGKEISEWLDKKAFYWSDRLPFSFQQGWTTNWMSLICDEDEGLVINDIDFLEKHYWNCRRYHEEIYGNIK